MSKTVTVDARGLACPQPVLKTKEALERNPGTRIEVFVDNPGSCENVARFARNQGCEVQSLVEADAYRVILSAVQSQPLPEERDAHPCPARSGKGIVLFIGADQMGRGSEELGRKLMRGFLRTWLDSERKPWRVLFLNSGVRLTTVDAEAVEILELLSDRGVEILSCGTCLEHFNLSKSLRVGRITNMYEVVETLSEANRVVSPA